MSFGSPDPPPSPDPKLSKEIYQKFYEVGLNDWRYEPEAINLPQEYYPYAEQGYQTGIRERQLQSMMESFQSSFALPEMPTYEGPSYEEQLAMQQEQMGKQERDELYSGYLTAVEQATGYVNSQIEQEMANANLLGIDYDITDEQKRQRISDYFATIWGAGDQARLEELMGTYGNPEGFTDWLVIRGNPENIKGTKAKSEQVSATKGLKPKPTILTEEESTLGSPATVLGV